MIFSIMEHISKIIQELIGGKPAQIARSVIVVTTSVTGGFLGHRLTGLVGDTIGRWGRWGGTLYNILFSILIGTGIVLGAIIGYNIAISCIQKNRIKKQ